MENWQIQKAKNRFSELLCKAQEAGPQTITRYGKAKAVLVSMKDYRKLMRKQDSLTEFFQKSPLKGVELDLNRKNERGREVEL